MFLTFLKSIDIVSVNVELNKLIIFMCAAVVVRFSRDAISSLCSV